MPSMISWLMSLPLVDEIPAHDRVVPDVEWPRARDGERHVLFPGREHFAAKPLAPLDLAPRADRDSSPYRRREMPWRAQGALGPGRGHLDRVALEVAAEDVRDALA